MIDLLLAFGLVFGLAFMGFICFMVGVIGATYSITDRLANGDIEKQKEILEQIKQGKQ